MGYGAHWWGVNRLVDSSRPHGAFVGYKGLLRGCQILGFICAVSLYYLPYGIFFLCGGQKL